MAIPYKKLLRPFKNIYVLILIVFLIWMLFFDTNSWLTHRELNSEIETLDDKKTYFEKEIKNDKEQIKSLSTEHGMEKMARETYYMKKENEEIYIIEYADSIPPKSKK